MTTVDLLQDRARRSALVCVTLSPTPGDVLAARIDAINVAIAQASLVDDRPDRVVRLVRLLQEVSGETKNVVEKWSGAEPDDAILDNLKVALWVIDGMELSGPVEEFWICPVGYTYSAT
jgi:hypothetical protein